VVPNAVESVTIRNVPFDDAGFKYVLSRPWLEPYSGPTRNDVDPTTLQGKVMVGYQGWFRAPNDLTDRGWIHWCRNGTMTPENLSVDQWPELTGFSADELFPAGSMLTGNGQPAYLFSSTTPKTVERHFNWMRQNQIDGVFLQRFVHPDTSGAWGHDEWVLHNVREAANRQGRIWAIEYDVSALAAHADPLAVIRTDWQWLVDVAGILKDPRYAREGIKPVVFVWGLSFPMYNFSIETADAIAEYFKTDPVYGGNYLIGGVRWDWRTHAAFQDWTNHFQRYDGLLSWMPPGANNYADDAQQLTAWGMDYFPHVWPGFSWAHLQQEPPEESYFEPRNGGDFFWQKTCDALGSNPGRLFVGMFDEYDESTAIMPMSDDPPDSYTEWGRFITNTGKPSDWWMQLTGQAKEMLLGQRPLDCQLPLVPELANRSNTGAEIQVDLGAADRGYRLYPVDVPDGHTSAVAYSNRDCRINTTPGEDLYFYFNVDTLLAFEVAQGMDVTIEVEYFDGNGDIDLTLEYDGINGVYTLHPRRITTRGSGLWLTARFEISDAYFGDRQNGGSDFRLGLQITQNSRMYIDHVRVIRADHPVGWVSNGHPYIPYLPTPMDAATDIGRDPPLVWSGGDPDDGDTPGYDIYFGTSPTPPVVISDYTATV